MRRKELNLCIRRTDEVIWVDERRKRDVRLSHQSVCCTLCPNVFVSLNFVEEERSEFPEHL